MLSNQLEKIITSLSPEDLEATLSTLRKIFDNIIQHPNDDKYCQIKLANKTFSSKVWRYPACEELMKMSGWIVEDDHVRLRDDSHVLIVSQLLKSLCVQKDISQSQFSSLDSIVTKYSVGEYKALISAVLNGNISDIQSLLKPRNISTSGRIYSEDNCSTNLLYAAILSQKIEVLELLVWKYAVNPKSIEDKEDSITLELFRVAPQSFIITYLKTCVSINSNKDFTLLHLAVFTSCFDVVCFLVEDCGVDVNIKDDDFYTPLHIAYLAGHTHIAQYLIQHGANEMTVDKTGCIPYAYIDGDPQITASSQLGQNCRKIHQVPGSAECCYYIKLCNNGIAPTEAVTLTMEQFPSLTEDGLTQPHYAIDYTLFTEELTQYITKRSSSDQPWRLLKSEQTRHLPFIF